MRGIFWFCPWNRLLARFNPAYAGNIWVGVMPQSVYQVQPRVCGEYNKKAQIGKPTLGSTPRMRGIFDITIRQKSDNRFNPAYAGNIQKWQQSAMPTQVQPRVCGEYNRKSASRRRNVGSTPRMRGIFNNLFSFFFQIRFNPAYAGNIKYGK